MEAPAIYSVGRQSQDTGQKRILMYYVGAGEFVPLRVLLPKWGYISIGCTLRFSGGENFAAPPGPGIS